MDLSNASPATSKQTVEVGVEDEPSPNVSAAQPRLGPTAAALAQALEGGQSTLLHVAADEREADDLAALVSALAPEVETLVFPPWDCLPYDRASPSAASMAARLQVLLTLGRSGSIRRLVTTSPEAIIQLTLAPCSLADLEHLVVVNRPGEVEAITSYAHRTGYRRQEEVAEPGDFCLRGEVLDIFPAASTSPCRLLIADGTVTSLHSFDPLTQLTTGGLEVLTLGPASELIAPEGDAEPDIFPATGPRPLGVEHDLPRLSGPLVPLLDHMPDAAVSLSPTITLERLKTLADQITSAFDTATSVGKDKVRPQPPRPEALYLPADRLMAGIKDRKQVHLETEARDTPVFALASQPMREAADHVSSVLEEGGVVVLAGIKTDLDRLGPALEKRTGRKCRHIDDWASVRKAEAGEILTLKADLGRGFELAHPRICVVAAIDVLGAKAQHATHQTQASLLATEPDLRFGDLVIHEDHGVGVLQALETVQADGRAQPTVRLDYHDGAALLVAADELRKVWRYGAEADVVALDRLNTGGWAKRRAEVETAITETATELVKLAQVRDETVAPAISPPRQAYERFLARFPYPLTEDQGAAVEAILKDLQAGRPMNRLVCGDVGFGKTEVALRAAAAVALSGRQVAVAAPTTVLARQHLQTFERRFAELRIKVGHLSRLATPAEIKETKTGLVSGDIGVVVGTHALAGGDVAFKDLGLLIIDEEQRFGAKLKAKLHALAPQAHVLILTATPIPRTLQASLVGLQEVSVIATPPARRRPVRTLLAPFDPATVRTALQRERARGGQSFVVTPRIEDIDGLRAQLTELAPELSLLVAHGELAPQEVDETMVRFADGDGDVLLATNIIESGLDVPRANTMLVHHPDRFGLAQLHQLRGRVGRGRAQASAYLMYDPAYPLSQAAQARLETLVAYDRLGAGLAISARDLDLRGAGDLVGEDQAGHLKLIGVGLYQWLLGRAVRQVRGQPVDDRQEPELALEAAGILPESYIPDPEVRLNLYARLSRLDTAAGVNAFGHELEDRFGPLPEEAEALLAVARLRRLGRDIGATRIAAGPKGVALDFADSDSAARIGAGRKGVKVHDHRVVWPLRSEAGAKRLSVIRSLLEELDT